MDESPLHFQAACESQLGPSKDDKAHLRTGSIGHSLLYEPDTVAERFVVWEGGDRRRKEYKDWAAEQTRTILSLAEYQVGERIANAVRSHPVAAELTVGDLGAAIEQRIYWTDPETGIALSGKPDVAGWRLVDLKSSARKPKWFERWAVDAHYPSQLAMYADGLAVLDRPPREHYLIFVESKPPNDVIVYECGAGVLAYGRKLYRRWLRELVRCLELDQWPGRAATPVAFELPAYLDDGPTITFNGEVAF